MAAAADERNKAFVLEAFDALANRRDFVAAQRFWSPDYIQHSAHVPPGRDGLFDLVRASPPDRRYENALTLADGDYVMLHGPFDHHWAGTQSDHRGHRAPGRRADRRTLGRGAGRGHHRGIYERAAHDRRQLPDRGLTRAVGSIRLPTAAKFTRRREWKMALAGY
jgi:predicted SnoaL-like aldol condensation-catalyzing enzyme